MNGVSTLIKNWGNKGIDLFKKKLRPNLVNLDVDWANTKWSGLAGPLTGIIGGGVGDFVGMNDRQDSLSSSINSYGQDAFDNITDNSSLIMAGTMPNMSAITDKDIRDKTWGEDIGSAVTNGIGAGFSTGNWLLGAGVAAFDLGKSLIERVQAGSLADTLEEQRRNKERGLGRQLYAAALGVDERNDFNRLMSYYDFPYDYAFGGLLHSHGGDYNGGLTYIDEGGRHEENPYEGVPSGFDEEGNPNLVEEGEVIWNNEYVFSDRLKVPEELVKKYKLGGKKDYTFAEAIEKVTKENKVSPTDAITIATTKEIVNEFMEAQEALREQEQIAAREELEAAQAQDFLAQLEAAQGGGYPMGAPVNMGNAGMGMPNEAPVTEGEMMPPGYAFGGNKFVGGGDKDGLIQIGTDANGNTVYILPNGTTVSSYREAQARIANMSAEELNFALNKSIPYAAVNPEELEASYATYTAPRPQQPQRAATDKDFEITEVLTNSYTADLKRRKGYKVGNQVFLSRKDAENAADTLRLEYATTLRDIPGYGKGYRLSDGTVVATKGEARKKQKERNRSLRVSYSQSSGNSATTTKQAAEQAAMEDIARATGATSATDSLSGTMVPMSATSTTVPSGTTGTGSTTGTAGTTGSTGTTSTVRRSTGTGTRSSSGAPAPTGGTVPEINSWESLYSALEGYNGSLGESAADGKYAIDRNSAYWKSRTAKDIEGDEAYGKFSDWIKEHSDDPNVRKYFEYLDKRINKSKGAKTLLKYDKNGKVTGLADDWKTTFDERRNDGDLGAYHINPSNLDFLTKPSSVTVPDVKLSDFDYNVPFDTDAYLNGTTTEPTGNGDSTTTTTTNSPRFNYRDTYLRYAPAIGSSMAALYGMLNRPDYSNADRVINAAYRMGTPVNIPVETIGDYRRRNPYDERYLVNMANQNRLAAARGIANTAGGNRAMDLLGNMSLAHNNQQGLGEIMRQAYLANRQDDAQVSEFNRGTNVYNMNALNQRNLSQAQLNSHRQQASLSGLAQGYRMRQSIKDAWDAATMQSLNSTLASLGAIGKENEEYNMLMSMAENGYFPYYYGDRSIIKFNPYTGEKLVKNGGKLNRKKRRF